VGGGGAWGRRPACRPLFADHETVDGADSPVYAEGRVNAMVSELICLDLIHALHGSATTSRTTESPGTDKERKHESTHENAMATATLYSHLLGRYDLAALDAAVRWLELTAHLGQTRIGGAHGLVLHTLTDKALEVAGTGHFAPPDRELLYQADPYGVFIAHQFNQDDDAMVGHLKTRVLEPAGFYPSDGRADGLEEFRTGILRKIMDARFFVCLLTRREELASGGYVSSLWLYQEIGAAVALGKRPLLVVEDSIASSFAGGLTEVYEWIGFTRSSHPADFERIVARMNADLDHDLIPRPTSATGDCDPEARGGASQTGPVT
jgi:hypothetical protein